MIIDADHNCLVDEGRYDPSSSLDLGTSALQHNFMFKSMIPGRSIGPSCYCLFQFTRSLTLVSKQTDRDDMFETTTQ